MMAALENSEALEAPVLLVILNHPGNTQPVFEAIRNARPRRFYVAIDGPDVGGLTDIDAREQAQQIVRQVDWQCEVKTFFQDEDFTGSAGRSAAFNWFFGHEEEGIILEEHCVPSRSFFLYCQELLERYRSDHRVMHIGGNNFLKGWQKDRDYSYYFSRNGHVCGWATWRRAWQHFDLSIALYPELREKESFRSTFEHWPERLYRLRKFDKAVHGTPSPESWDVQWDFARYINSGLAIVPQVNLVSSTGGGHMRRRSQQTAMRVAQAAAQDIELPLRHPPFVIGDLESDNRDFKNFIRDIIFSKLGI